MSTKKDPVEETGLDQFVRQRIAALRNQKGVSAREMSLSCGLSEGYINHVENGLSSPSVHTLSFIFEYLNITHKEFFDDGAQDPVRLREIIHDLEGLSPSQLEHVAAIVKGLKR